MTPVKSVLPMNNYDVIKSVKKDGVLVTINK